VISKEVVEGKSAGRLYIYADRADRTGERERIVGRA